MGASGTSGGRGGIGSAARRYEWRQPSGQIDERGGNEKRGDASAFREVLVFALDHVEPADSRADVDAGFVSDLRGDLQSAMRMAKSAAAMAN